MTNANFSFRQARNLDELEQLFRLRFTVFKNAHPSFVPDNLHGLELDAYDIRAHHFGLFREVNGAATPIGYLRVSGNNCPEKANWVLQIAARHQLSNALTICPVVPLPMMKYFSSACDKINCLYRDARSKGESMMEGGRLCLSPEFENPGLACFIIESAIVFVLFHQGANAILSCKEGHLPVYARYGFKPLEEIPKQKIAGHDSLVLMIKYSERYDLRPSLLKKLEAMLEQYELKGEFTFPIPANKFVNFQSLCA